MNHTYKIAVVIPCYKVRNHIIDVLNKIDTSVNLIYVVDDFCPEKTGDLVRLNIKDKRIKVIKHDANKGVGAAVISGYKEAIKDGADIVIKVDGDGQMDPALIPEFIYPIINGEADYTKGNRFFNLEEILTMPKKRIFGNAALSFVNKISSGYWNIFDPTNGFTAIHSDLIKALPLDKISKRYFFESDMLFRLNTLKAVVLDIPMHANYGNESSNLNVRNILLEFLWKHIRNTFKRIFYNYYLRDMSVASFELPLGIILFCFGLVYGLNKWLYYFHNNLAAPTGSVVLPALSILIGLQFILGFLSYDILSIPTKVLHRKY
jgi:glycosyltransferase involved in cell wall biosynthesis